MNKNFFITLLILVSLLVCTAKTFAADSGVVLTDVKFAVVDVAAVVSNSKKVVALKKEQEQKMQDLKKWLDTARSEVSKQSTQEGKDKLIKKYDAEFAKKQENLKKEYAEKLQIIDNEISGVVAKEAKAKKYNMVFAKGTVLFGGEDITPVIIKAVK